MTAAFLAAVATTLGLRLWLASRHMRCVREHRDAVPEAFAERIPLEAHRKAADYTVARTRAALLELAARTVLLLAWTLGGGLDRLDALWPRGSAIAGAGFILSAYFLTELLLLPFAVHRVFRIEERFGFNRLTVRAFCSDLLKGLLIALLFGGALFYGALRLMDGAGRAWWLWAAAGWLAFSCFLLWIYPTLIAPLFNRFTPLEDADLKERLDALLARTGFESGGLFVMDGSRRSTHANAYFTGLGRRKRIVLFDTLLEMLTPGETEAVLAHELGHFKRGHVRQRLLVGSALVLAGLALLDALLRQDWFYEGLGVSVSSDRTALLLFLWVVPLFTFPLRPLYSARSRRQEFEADRFAAEHSETAALIRALVKLYEKNAATLTPDPLHSAFHDSHPPAALRIARLGDIG